MDTDVSSTASRAMWLGGAALIALSFTVAGCAVDDTQDAEDVIPFESILASASPSPPPKCEDYFASGCGGPCPDPAQAQCVNVIQGASSSCQCVNYCLAASAGPPVNGVCPAGYAVVTTSTVCGGAFLSTKTCLKPYGTCPTPGHVCKLVPKTYAETRGGTTCTVTTRVPACA